VSSSKAPLVSGGYFLVSGSKRAGYQNAALVPELVLSVCEDICETAPNTWAIRWTGDSEGLRRDAGSAFGLDADTLGVFCEWATEAIETEALDWPNVFFDLAEAERVLAEFLPAGASLLNIALPADLAPSFIQAAMPADGMGPPGVYEAVAAGRPPEPGDSLGWDILGWNTGGFESYLCNGLETVYATMFNARPNAHGLYEGETLARVLAAHTNRSDVGAEPGLWLPWHVQRYTSDPTPGVAVTDR
jgi:hypothetical protein